MSRMLSTEWSDIDMPNMIIDEFNNSSNSITPDLTNDLNKIDNLNIGDHFVIKTVRQISNTPSETYLYLKVVNIVDDGLTSDNSGTELDYIELDIKYFSANRF
jgi:hypothetical protein